MITSLTYDAAGKDYRQIPASIIPDRYRPAVAAYALYAARRFHRAHPEGATDVAGRWYPAAREWQPCCARPPRRYGCASGRDTPMTGHRVTTLVTTGAYALCKCDRCVRQPWQLRTAGGKYSHTIAFFASREAAYTAFMQATGRKRSGGTP